MKKIKDDKNKDIILRQGEIINAGIIGIGKKGNPFAKYKGKIIYIKNYKEKQFRIKKMIKIKITKAFQSFAFGDII